MLAYYYYYYLMHMLYILGCYKDRDYLDISLEG